MKSLVLYGAAMACGLMMGVGGTLLEFRGEVDAVAVGKLAVPLQRRADLAEVVVRDVTARGPVATVVGDANHDFGTMDRTETGQHTFLIKNEGDAILTLKTGSTTCKCAVSEIEKEHFQPGETAKVAMEWEADLKGPDPAYEQSANILTNDPNRPIIDLRVKGLITEILRAMPYEIALGSVPSNQGHTAQFRLFGSRIDQIQIQEVSFDDATTADFFELNFEPLDDEEVAKEDGADCGLLAVLTVKSGLPLGPIRQTIRLKADVGKDLELAVPVMGQVSGDILFSSSSNFDSSRNLLSLGAVRSAEGAECKLFMFIKGEHRNDVEISVAEIEPEGYLNVEIGEPDETLSGRTVRRLVTVRIPPGLAPINRLGGAVGHGRILIETTHPTSKQIPIRVRFATE